MNTQTALVGALAIMVSAIFMPGNNAFSLPSRENVMHVYDGGHKRFNPRTVQTWNGLLSGILIMAPAGTSTEQMYIFLKTTEETIPVHLGPEWYVEEQDIELLTGDRITVSGSRGIVQGRPAIIATEVRGKGRILTLRSNDGIPTWDEEKE